MPDLRGDEIEISTNAQDAIRQRMDMGDNVRGLRLTMKQKGCAGFTPGLELVREGEEVQTDFRFVQGDIVIYIPQEAFLHIMGLKIDYGQDDLRNTGFQFEFPMSKGACGCGLSLNF